MTFHLRQLVIPFYLFACLLLGGSSRAPWSNMVLQLGAGAIIGWAVMARPRYKAGRPGTQLAVMLFVLVAIIGLQLIPLPPAAWSALPARDAVAHGFELLDMPLPWLPLSLSPYDTLASALWLLPPLAVLAGVVRLGAYRETWMALAILLAALAGVILGTLQFAGTSDAPSSWYLYSITNEGAAVGFFANSNHMAILLVATVPFVVALYQARSDRTSTRRARASAGKAAILAGAMMVILVGIVLNGSLAGYALGAIALIASVFVRIRLEGTRAKWGLAAVGLGGLLAIAAIFISPIQNNLTATGVETDYSSRYTSFTNSLRVAADYFPVGSGVGTFADVYPAYENSAWVDRWYVNHVHNDYIELALETGLPGIILMIWFVLWWIERTVAIWRAPNIDHFARAATIASAAIMLHSLVDFPLRTTAIASLFASCIAIMVGMRRQPKIEASLEEDAGGARHLSLA